MTTKNTRILISGAGIAGFTLAYFLKQKGYSPTIVEKHPHLREGGYKVDIRGTALEVVRRMGIYQDLINAKVNLKKSKLVTPSLKTFEFDEDILGHCSKEDIEVNRWDLVQILSKAVGDIEIIYDDSITVIDKTVHFKKMQPREFDLIVGADGLYSNVRKLTFGEDSNFLKKYNICFSVFPIPNIFKLEHAEIVYLNKGKFIAAYAANEHSYACLAFKSERPLSSDKNLTSIFEKQFQNLGWEVPRLISHMKASRSSYYNSIAQVRMPYWSKNQVVLLGDAAYAASAMGTSLSIVGAYVLAREIENANGNHKKAFYKYETSIRDFVERSQKLAESNHQLLEESKPSIKAALQLYLIKMLPKKVIKLITKKRRKEMHKTAYSLLLEPLP